MKKKLLVSFSGGRTSAYMLWLIMRTMLDEYEIVIVFANTGKEREETLEFVERCSTEWGCKIVWVEAVPKQSKLRKNKKGKWIGGKWWGVDHKIVDFKTASRKGEPFEEMISKLGIPSTNAPFCSDQLKRKAIESYLKSIGWKRYYKALGIRADEIDRMNPKYKKKRILYPLVSKGITKHQVRGWWKLQPFDLAVEDGLGNCDGCWKKDIITLCRNARKKPEVFDWWQSMTDKYGSFNPRNTHLKPPFNFYRGNLSPKDIFVLSTLSDDKINKMAKREKLDGCSESCELLF